MSQSELRIVPLNDGLESAYQDFVFAHPESMFFHSISYLRFLRQMLVADYNVLIALDADDRVQGVLSALIRYGALGKVINSLPYYGSNGGVLASNEIAARQLVNTWNVLTGAVGVVSATMVSNPMAKVDYGCATRHDICDTRIGQITNIAYSDDHGAKLMNSYHYKTRNMVRKSQKQGFTVAIENSNVDFIRTVHRENMVAIGGRAKADSFFTIFPEHFHSDTDYQIWVARSNGEPIAALLLFYYRDTVEYYMPVIKAEWRNRQPLSLLIFEAMCETSRRGFRLWNWGGTWISQDGVYLFKKRWGAWECVYTYYTRVNDERLYATSREILLQEYPDFFVIPFNCLKEVA